MLGSSPGKRAYSTAHAESYCYAVTSRQALSLLRLVLPHLKSYKRDRAQLALALYQSLTPRNGKYTSNLRTARDQFEQDFLSIRPDTRVM